MAGCSLQRCLDLMKTQRHRLLSKAIGIWKMLIVQDIPNAVIISQVHEIEEMADTETVEEARIRILAKAMNNICGYKLRRVLHCFHLWRAYSYYVKCIDPDLFNSSSAVGNLAESLEESEDSPNENPKEFIELERFPRIDEISRGLRFLTNLQFNRKAEGYHKILCFVKTFRSEDYKHQLAVRFNALQKILLCLSRQRLPYFRRWRSVIRSSKFSSERLKLTLSKFVKTLELRIKFLPLFQGFSAISLFSKEHIDYSVESFHSENIPDEEDTVMPLSQPGNNKVDLSIFSEELRKKEGEFNNILKEQQSLVSPFRSLSDEELKRRINEICLSLINDIFSKRKTLK